MILELILIGSATKHWRKQRHKRTDLAELEGKKTASVAEKFNPKKLFENIKNVFTDGECQPAVVNQADADKSTGSGNPFLESNVLISAGSLSMSLLGSVSPIFTLMAIAGILYIARSLIFLAFQDLKNKPFSN